ncbi:retron system putative HNH endonuclease [Corynebacterium aquatimens]|uniref:retron system putative HNH endonuclease n=2 Tax=Corynebacterium TaxID=1716 RepID=UPI001F3FE7A6|nr:MULTISPECIES: retron system putative HNH endonuclease [Corynebacterium]
MSESDEGSLCHYCERSIKWKKDRYSIDHLFPRHRFPDRTFDWANLYLSCKTPDHCEQYKDAPGHPDYDPADLVRPDVDDPDRFFQFLSDGRVIPRPGIREPDRHRAETTIEVLNLNCPRLVTSRRQVVSMAEAIVSEVMELSGLSPDEREELLRLEIRDARSDLSRIAHGTVARHYFFYFRWADCDEVSTSPSKP